MSLLSFKDLSMNNSGSVRGHLLRDEVPGSNYSDNKAETGNQAVKKASDKGPARLFEEVVKYKERCWLVEKMIRKRIPMNDVQSCMNKVSDLVEESEDDWKLDIALVIMKKKLKDIKKNLKKALRDKEAVVREVKRKHEAAKANKIIKEAEKKASKMRKILKSKNGKKLKKLLEKRTRKMKMPRKRNIPQKIKEYEELFGEKEDEDKESGNV